MGVASLAMLVGVVIATAGVGVIAEPRTVWDGVYTAAQATRGKAIYQQQCRACHGEDLKGDGVIVSLAGDRFAARWRSASVNDLFVAVQTTMPLYYPSALSDTEYADVIAYLLNRNNVPAGAQELSTRLADLRQISFKKP